MHGRALGGWHSISLRVLLALISIFGSVAKALPVFPQLGGTHLRHSIWVSVATAFAFVIALLISCQRMGNITPSESMEELQETAVFQDGTQTDKAARSVDVEC
jgi:hypothetical protein